MQRKTNEDRIIRIVELSENHFGLGEVKFVGIKYDPQTRVWVAKLRLHSYASIYESGDNPDTALKALKNRVKKIIKRYNAV